MSILKHTSLPQFTPPPPPSQSGALAGYNLPSSGALAGYNLPSSGAPAGYNLPPSGALAGHGFLLHHSENLLTYRL